MARVNNGLISGKIGPVVYYVVKGKQLVRSHQPNVRRCDKSLVAAKVFGVAVGLSRDIRRSLSLQLPSYENKALKNRLNGVVHSTINPMWREKNKTFLLKRDGFSGMDGFDFSGDSNFSEYLKVVPRVWLRNQTLKVAIPGLKYNQNLLFPERCMKCDVIVGLSLFRLKEGLYMPLSENQRLEVNTIQDTESLVLQFDVPKGCLIIVSLTLDFSLPSPAGWKSVTTKEFNPGQILAAFYNIGNYAENGSRKWSRGTYFQ